MGMNSYFDSFSGCVLVSPLALFESLSTSNISFLYILSYIYLFLNLVWNKVQDIERIHTH